MKSNHNDPYSELGLVEMQRGFGLGVLSCETDLSNVVKLDHSDSLVLEHILTAN